MPNTITASALKDFARTFLPHMCRLPFNRFHDYMFERRALKLPGQDCEDPQSANALEARRGAIDLVMAPRGAAKSTLMSLAFPLHALVHRLERYIVIISATLRQAQQRLASLRGVLNMPCAALREAFPHLFETKVRASQSVIEHNDVRIEAAGAIGELRGIAFGAWRPTWIILDDIERSDRIRSRDYRDQLENWFARWSRTSAPPTPTSM